MSTFSYERYDRQQRRRPVQVSGRSALGYWLPLALTVTVATVGVAAWIWNERRDGGDSYDDSSASSRRRKSGRRRSQAEQSTGPPPSFIAQPGPGETSFGAQAETEEDSSRWEMEVAVEHTEEESGLVARVSDAIRRTPTPQQLYNAASRGVAAAGAVVGNRLGVMGREPKEDFRDHERWEEEAETRARSEGFATAERATAAGAMGGSPTGQVAGEPRPHPQTRGRRRLVAVVVSAASSGAEDSYEEDAAYHASILSHLPHSINASTTQLLILIYAPHLTVHPLSSSASPPWRKPAATLISSSYSNVSRLSSQSNSPRLHQGPSELGATDSNQPGALYTHLSSTAASFVPHPTHILPFTTPTGHLHLLRHLAPSLVYIEESLCGSDQDGEVVKQIEGWVGQVVVVVGAGVAGLVDTETETDGEGNGPQKGSRRPKWWMDEKRVGLGKGVEVVEGMRVEEDWGKRVGG